MIGSESTSTPSMSKSTAEGVMGVLIQRGA